MNATAASIPWTNSISRIANSPKSKPLKTSDPCKSSGNTSSSRKTQQNHLRPDGLVCEGVKVKHVTLKDIASSRKLDAKRPNHS